MAKILPIVEKIIQEELGKDGKYISLTLNNLCQAEDLNTRIHDIGFGVSEARYSYLISRSIQDMAIVERCMHFLKQNNLLEFLKWVVPLKRNGSINVCCLGGGSGVESIGIVDSLNLKEDYLADMKLHVTNIDVQEEWKKPFEKILDKAFHQLSKWKGESATSFQNADLMKPLSEETKKVISESDIITVVRFISSVINDSDGCRTLLKEVFTNMKCGSIIIFVDFDGNYHQLYQEIAMDPEFHMKLLRSRSIFTPNLFPRKSSMARDCEKKYGILPNIRSKALTSAWKKEAESDDITVNELASAIDSLKISVKAKRKWNTKRYGSRKQ